LNKKKDWFIGANAWLQHDITQEGGYPDLIILLKTVLDQTKIVAWLKRSESEDYHLFFKNCIKIVSEALEVGGLPVFESRSNFIVKRIYNIAPSTQVHASKVVDALMLAGGTTGFRQFYMKLDMLILELVVSAMLIYMPILIFEFFCCAWSGNDPLENFSCLEPKLKYLRSLVFGKSRT
jgi:hypothetical protein